MGQGDNKNQVHGGLGLKDTKISKVDIISVINDLLSWHMIFFLKCSRFYFRNLFSFTPSPSPNRTKLQPFKQVPPKVTPPFLHQHPIGKSLLLSFSFLVGPYFFAFLLSFSMTFQQKNKAIKHTKNFLRGKIEDKKNT